MTSKIRLFALSIGSSVIAWTLIHAADAKSIADWPQWARTFLHTSSIHAVGQSPKTKLADITYDPFVSQEKAETFGELLAHYQVPLVDGNSVFLEYKTGKYVSCNPQGSGQP